ncbi:MAG TPA: ABC transporter permease, partial [Chloroflexota bacterium]|nr:ABC transporter permease [Chloroflexota bacterium]
MTALFGYSLDTIARTLFIVCGVLLAGVLLLALRRPILLRIALRQLPRRRAQMVLIALGLALGASIITSVFLTGDTVQTAINMQVVQGLGRIDEILHDSSGPYVPGDVDLTSFSGIDTAAPSTGIRAVFLDELSGHLTTQQDWQPEVYFPLSVYGTMRNALAHSTAITALMPEAVEHHALLTDATSRQIRGQVKMIGLPARRPGAFGVLTDGHGRLVDPARMPPGAAAINAVAASDLGAGVGDQLLLFLNQQRYSFRLDAIVNNGGLAGATPSILLPLRTLEAMVHQPGAIDRILVVNRGADDATAAAMSDQAAGELYSVAPPSLAVDEAKASGLRVAEQAQEIFSRIFTLFALFAAGVGLLLVFLIFTILAADRRPEMGISRVVGMKRRDLLRVYLYEGTVYALVSSALGLALGIGIGAAIVNGLNLVLDNYGFTLAFVLHQRVAVISYALGLLATWVTVVLACWWATRLTLSSAIRDLPEPAELPPGPLRVLLRPWRRPRQRAAGFLRAVLRSLIAALLAACAHGPGLFGVGAILAWWGAYQDQTATFAAGITVAILGATLALRSLSRFFLAAAAGDRLAFSLGGVALVSYWSLPADALTALGLPALNTGIEIFFLAGVAMVLGAVWLVMYNLDALVRPLTGMLRLPGKLTAAVRTAAAYTLHRPARTGMILAMFGLVSFTLTVMAVVTDALERTYGDVQAQTGGFDIRGDLLYNDPISSLAAAMREGHDLDPHAFSFVGGQGYVPVGVVQLSAPQPAWRLTY